MLGVLTSKGFLNHPVKKFQRQQNLCPQDTAAFDGKIGTTLLRGEELGLELSPALSLSSNHCRICKFGMSPFVMPHQILLHRALLLYTQ